MAELDLKNPGNKEIVVAGGAALLLALIYFAFQKKSPAAAGVPSTSGGAGPGGATGGVVPSYLLPLGSGGGAASATGNAFTDSMLTVQGTAGGVSPSFTLRPPSLSSTGQNVLNVGGSSNPFVGDGGGGVGGGGGGFVPGPAGTAPAGSSGSGFVTYAHIFQALVAKGLSAVEASGVLGNIQNESSGNVENTSGDAGTSIGLIQWHNKDKYLVTGNLAHDFANQVNAIVSWFKSAGVSGSTPQAVASSFASNVEGCVGCQPGGSQNVARQANAAAFYQQYLKGAFNPPKPTTTTATTTNTNYPGGLTAWTAGGWQAAYKKLFGVYPPGYTPPATKAKPKAGEGVKAATRQPASLFSSVRQIIRLFSGAKPRPATQPRRPAPAPNAFMFWRRWH